MTCTECCDSLAELLEQTLSPQLEREVRLHVATCSNCRREWEREEQGGRAVTAALQRAAAPLRLDPARRTAILQCAAAETVAASPRDAWRWQPWVGLAAAAAILGLLLAPSATQLGRRAGARPGTAPAAMIIDVPFQTNGGSGIAHAIFFESP